MESSKLYIEIDNIIRRNLQYAYNKNTAKISFSFSKTHIDQNSTIDSKSVSLTFPSLSASKIKSRRWRIPQTRIYIVKLSGLDYEICELQYFDISIILIKNYSAKKLSFDLKAKQTTRQLPENKPLKDKIFIDPETETVLLSGKSIKSNREIINYLNEIIEEERQFNPISKIFSKDLEFLKTIDVNWASLQWDSKQKIHRHLDEKDVVNQATSELLAELALYCDLVSESSSKKKVTKEEIQSFWDILSLPVFTYKLGDLIKTDTIHVIRFLISAYDNNFDWAEIARNRIRPLIIENLPTLLALFDLVFVLKAKYNIRHNLDCYSVSSYSSNLTSVADSIEKDSFGIKVVKTKKETFTYARFPGLDIVSINKAARISFNKQGRTVEIEPQTYQYELSNVNICSIVLNSVHFKVVTAWKDFVVNLGKVHLKFLFKKDRYQVSIKGHSSIENFKLNDSQFNFKKSRYNKIYYVPVVGKGVLDIYYSDTCGRQIADKNTLRSVVVNVIAVNRYGQLIDNVHLRKKQSKKNLKLNPPGTYTNVIRADNKYDLSVPKEQTVSVELDSSTSLLTKFFYTESHLLQQRWCLFTADKSKTEAIRESFYTTFGLWLNCMPLAEINNYFATENLIIANKPSAEKYDTFQFHDEILLKQNGMKKALFFTEEKFNKWIKSLENAAQGTRRFI